MELLRTLTTINLFMGEQLFDVDNIKRNSALVAFKLTEKLTQNFPYITRLKPMQSCVVNEGLFVLMDQTFQLYETENRKSLNNMKTDHSKKINQVIRSYMKNGNMILTKERLKQYLPLTIRKDVACQTLFACAIDVVLFSAKMAFIHKYNRMQLAVLSAGILYSFVETMKELEETSEINKEVDVQTQLHNQRCHNMISCYLNVAENKDLEGNFHDDTSIKGILDGIDEYVNKTLNDSALSVKRNKRFYKQQRVTTSLMLAFNNVSILNTLHESNALINNIMYTCFNLTQIGESLDALNMKEVEMSEVENKRSIVNWSRMDRDEIPLYTIKKFRFCYSGTDRVVLKNDFDDIHIKQNCWLQVRGPSGCGKSTLIKLFLKTIDTDYPNAFVFLNHPDYDFISIREFVSTNSVGNGLFYDTVEFNVYYSINHRDDELVKYYFNMFNIGDFDREREKNINMMSSGQQQKIKVIRIILLILQRLYQPDVRHKQIFFLDEPTANMDPASEATVLSELKRLREKYNLSFIFVSHSVAAGKYADEHLIVGADGQLSLGTKPVKDAITLVIDDSKSVK